MRAPDLVPEHRPPAAAARPTRAQVQRGRSNFPGVLAGLGRPPRRRRRGGVRLGRLAVVLAVPVVLIVVAVTAMARLSAAPPVATVGFDRLVPVTVAGTAPVLPWPPTGEAAVSIPAIGYTQESGLETPVPVASLTKIMTAYIILRDHPLPALSSSVPLGGPDPASTDGPSITMTATDQAYFDAASSTDQSNAPVQPGEVLTERQLIEGMLVHSANNFAETLARWDAGSVPAFVAKMNATAAALGMHQTHFVDASGYDPGSVSTAADLLKVTAAAMAEPAFARTVTMTSVTLPVAGLLSTYTPLVGTDGVIGVKSGFTSEAGGCVVTAIQRVVHGQSMVILAAVLGQQAYDALGQAGLSALNVAEKAATGVVEVPVVDPGTPVASLSVDGRRVQAVTAAAASMLAWPGQTIERRGVVTARLRAGAAPGTMVGLVRATLGSQSVAVAVSTDHRLPPPGLAQRLL